MKILLTGGSGFIGTWILIKLSLKNNIICLDHGRHYPELQSIINDNIELVEGDITALAHATKELVGTITSLFLTSKNLSATSSADVPEFNVIAYLIPTYLAKLFSNFSMFEPRVNIPDFKQFLISFRMPSRSSSLKKGLALGIST